MDARAHSSDLDLAIASRVLKRWWAITGDVEAAASIVTLSPVDVVRAGAAFPRSNGALAPRVVLAGWGCRSATLPDARRQIFDFVLPGDVVATAFHERPLNRLQVQAITPVRLVPAHAIGFDDAMMTRAFASLAGEEEERLLDQIVRLGRQTAYERTIHLLLELCRRLSLVGLAKDGSFEFPLTQAVIADALGLSIVHVNRTLQQLRRERMIDHQRGRISLLQPERMRTNCDFQTGMQASA